MQFDSIDNGKSFDWGKTCEEYARYRDIYPQEYYELMVSAALGVKGQKCLDLGTGTGVLPRAMYKYGARWTGTDISEEQIKWAKIIAQKQNMNIDFFASPAESTGLADSTFDLITASQCWAYFDEKTVIPEIHRMLKPGGHFLMLYMTWLPYESKIAAGSEDLVQKYNPEWSGGGFKRNYMKTPDWSEYNFDCARYGDFAADVSFTKESWAGRMFACRGIGAASISAEKKILFKNELARFLSDFPCKFSIPHWISFIDFKKI